jgi:DNA invertase Pin-like site-specific DNA recombinase
MEDAVRKGRTSHAARNVGEKHPNAVLNLEKVRDIRTQYAHGSTLSELAAIFQVSVQQIFRIVNNQSWRTACILK